MRIRATCNACRRGFLFVQLYTAEPSTSDRCPHSNRHLGLPNGRHLALAADRAATNLRDSLRAIAGLNPGFTVKRESVLKGIEGIVAELSAPNTESAEQGSSDEGDIPIQRRGWPRRAA